MRPHAAERETAPARRRSPRSRVGREPTCAAPRNVVQLTREPERVDSRKKVESRPACRALLGGIGDVHPQGARRTSVETHPNGLINVKGELV